MKPNWQTKKLEHDGIKILVLAKAMFLRGCDFAGNKNEIDRMLAIHTFDNVVEMILNLIAEDSKLQKGNRKNNFHDLIEASGLDNTTKTQLSGLHNQRNPTQHHADIPDYETIIKYRGYTEDFIKTILKNRFDLSYDDIFRSLLIENKALGGLVKNAEKAFAEQDYKKTIELCEKVLLDAAFSDGDIFNKAGKLTRYLGGDELVKVIKSGYSEKYKEKDYYEFAKEISLAVLRLGQATTTMQFFNNDKIAFLEHRERIDNLEAISQEELKGEAEASLNFITNLVLKWQSESIIKQS